MTSLLSVRDLHQQRGGREVLRGLDLELRRGELVGLIAPNGSGKSTLLQTLLGLLPDWRGSIRVDGQDLALAPDQARAVMGYAVAPESLPLVITPRQCLGIVARLRDAAIDPAIEGADALGLSPWLDRPVSACSLGTRQKLAILLALLGNPPLILLDEVQNGLDPLAAYELKRQLRARVDAGAAVLLATHGLEVAERLLDRAVLLLDGRIVADWNRDDLARFRSDPEGGLEHAVAQWMRRHRDGSGSAA